MIAEREKMEYKRIVITIKNEIIWTQIFDKTDQIESSYISDTEIEALQKAQDFLGQKGNIVENLKDKLSRRNIQIKELKKQVEKLEEFAKSEIMCDCGKTLWLANFTNNPLV